MSQTWEFYDERARHAEAEAGKALLDNVREREMRSAKAWREMADRARTIEAGRIKADEIRAERRAAELEAAQAAEPVAL
ncbi:MAG TPA: hypothetical protein VI168_00930 [Croceibacterium sp.]